MFDRRSDRQTFYMRNHARHERRATTASRCNSKSKKGKTDVEQVGEGEREKREKKERERERKGGRREAAGVCIAS